MGLALYRHAFSYARQWLRSCHQNFIVDAFLFLNKVSNISLIEFFTRTVTLHSIPYILFRMPKFNKTEKVLIGVTAPVWVPLAMMFYIAVTPIVWVAKGAVAVEETSLYQKKKRKRDAKPPEAKSRQRPLSIDHTKTTGIPETDSVHKDNTAEAQKLPIFFRLPRELRLCIYEDIIGNENIHIMLIEGQIRSFRCKNKDCHNKKYGIDHCWIKYWRKATTPLDKPKYIYHESGINVLPLLQSCKAV